MKKFNNIDNQIELLKSRNLRILNENQIVIGICIYNQCRIYYLSDFTSYFKNNLL